MSDRNFQDALREGEAARSERTLPPDAERRIRAQAEAAFDRRRRFFLPSWTLGLATAAAAAALVVYVVARPGTQPEQPPAAVNGFVAEQGAAPGTLRAEGDTVVATARAEVVDPASRIHVVASRGATLKREGHGVRVLAGTVEVSVEKRHAGEPAAQVFVSDGVIEILGTRFTIEQDAGGHGGQVTLHEGSIRFRAANGREQLMRPGDTLHWPLRSEVALAPTPAAPAPAPTIAAPGAGGSGIASDAQDAQDADHAQHEAPAADHQDAPKPAPTSRTIASTTPQRRDVRPLAPVPNAPAVTPPAAAPSVDVDALIEELNVLRRRGQFADAASRLEQALRQPLPEATSERLSYELGSILTWQLRDTEKACEVWKAHRATHPSGRYAAEIDRAEQSLGCH